MITSINNFNVPNGLIEAYDRIKKLNDQHTYVLAVSGGKDSMLLWNLFLKAEKRIVIAHVNYGLRDESLEETKLVRKTALNTKTPCHILMVASKPVGNTQAWAREIRYRFFDSVLTSCAAKSIVTAHHQDDDFENFFIRALRGTSVKGLTSMSRNTNGVLRPLINTSRAHIDAFIEDSGIEYREDTSNAERKYFRNYLRHNILPELFEKNEQGKAGILRTLDNLSRSEAFIADVENSWKENSVVERSFGYTISLEHETAPFLIDRFLVSLNVPAAMVELIADHMQSDSNFYVESHIWIIEKVDSIMILKRASFKLAQRVHHTLQEWQSDSLFDVHAIDIYSPPPDSSVAILDTDKINFPISVVAWEEGMRIKPLGMNGKSRLISDVFIDLKVPRSLRNTVPVLIDNDDEVLWLCGLRTSEKIKVTEDTKLMVQVKLQEGTFSHPLT